MGLFGKASTDEQIVKSLKSENEQLKVRIDELIRENENLKEIQYNISFNLEKVDEINGFIKNSDEIVNFLHG